MAEDIRGRFKSEGKFVMMRPMIDRGADHHDPKATDESTDAYDTVAWLLKNVPGNNGRVGVIGTSYPGFLAMMAGIDPHPAVKAISPQAPMIDVWMGDDFFHNGAFRQSYGYDYVLGMESSKENTEVSYGKDKRRQARWTASTSFWSAAPSPQDVKQSGSKVLPTWKLFLDHPAYDTVWSSRGVEHMLNAVTVPTLTVGGYYDQEDMWGRRRSTPSSSRTTPSTRTSWCSGPGGMAIGRSSSRHLGNLDYGEPIGKEFRARHRSQVLRALSQGRAWNRPSGFDLEDTASFQTGSNTWKYYAHFPPPASSPTSLYLEGSGLLSWSALGRRSRHQLRERPRQSGSLPPPAHPAHL